jgi:hypothetical protein
MTEDPHKVVDLHPSEWKRGAERWPVFGAGAVPFLVYGVVGILVVTVLRWIAALL